MQTAKQSRAFFALFLYCLLSEGNCTLIYACSRVVLVVLFATTVLLRAHIYKQGEVNFIIDVCQIKKNILVNCVIFLAKSFGVLKKNRTFASAFERERDKKEFFDTIYINR